MGSIHKIWNLNPLYSGTLANSEDPDEMQPYAAFHRGLLSLLRLKQSLGTKIHNKLENSTCNPLLKYTMGCPILIVSTYMRKTIKYKGLKPHIYMHFLHSFLKYTCTGIYI